MSERSDARDTPAPQAPRPSLKRRALLIGGTIVALVVLYFIAASTVPRWWAHRIGDQVNGSISAGIGIGLFYGVVFTFIPLFILTFALRRRRSWRARAWLVAAAVLLALPNLMTLGIVLGSGSAAHAGERTLDVEAPDFRAATLAGAIIGALGVVAVYYLLVSRRRAKERASALRGELRTRDEAARAAAEAEKQP